jgi:hypothetical protein
MLCAATISAVGRASAQTESTPDAVIKELYRLHNQNSGQILGSKNLLNKFFDKNLAALIRKDVANPKVGVTDFDMFYDTQNTSGIKNFSIGRAKIEGAKASVPVSFTNAGERYKITYLLDKENGAWKIADMKYRNGDTMLKFFKETRD